MSPYIYIQTKLKSILEKSKMPSPEIDAVAVELVPSVVLTLTSDHTDTLSAIKNELATLSDEALVENPHMRRILDDSIQKVARIYEENYSNLSLSDTAETIITNDISALLKQDVSFWERAQKKTYQEIMNDVRPGSNDERVFLWLQEIKKNTDIAPETNEPVGVYSTRAITHFLRSQTSN